MERGGRDLQTQWSERFRLETMRTFLVTFEMGIAQHTTRGEDRPLLSPIANRVERGFWTGDEGGESGGGRMTCRLLLLVVVVVPEEECGAQLASKKAD